MHFVLFYQVSPIKLRNNNEKRSGQEGRLVYDVTAQMRAMGAAFVYVYLDSGQVVGVEDRPLVELHLGEVALKQGFQLKIRGNTEGTEQCMHSS